MDDFVELLERLIRERQVLPLLAFGAGFWLWALGELVTGQTLLTGGADRRSGAPLFWLAFGVKFLLGGAALVTALFIRFPRLQSQIAHLLTSPPLQKIIAGLTHYLPFIIIGVIGAGFFAIGCAEIYSGATLWREKGDVFRKYDPQAFWLSVAGHFGAGAAFLAGVLLGACPELRPAFLK